MPRPKHFLVCDFETTGKSPAMAELLSGSFLYCDEELNVLDRYDLKVRPRVWSRDAEEAVAIHGIDHATAMRFDPFELAIPALNKWLCTLERSYFVAHANRHLFGKVSSYDYIVLKSALFDIGEHWTLYRKCPPRYVISTHSLAKYMALPCDLNLKAIAQHLGLGAFEHHDAEADTLMCYEILKRLLPQVDLNEFLDYDYYRLTTEVKNDEQTRTRTSRRTPRKTESEPGQVQRAPSFNF